MSKTRIAASAAAALAIAVACVACASARQGPASVGGRLASGGGFLGDWDFYPTLCAVHDDAVVILDHAASTKRIRVVDRSRTPGTRDAKIDVHVAKDTPTGAMDLIFTDPACVKSSLTSGPTGYQGEVILDCQTGEGGHIVGKVTFDHCR
jgi:hypothetical protein